MILVKTIHHFWKSIFLILSILYLSFTPSSTFDSIPTFENEDKLIHLLMYLVLTGTLIFDTKKASKEPKVSANALLLICLIFPTLLGGTIEILQVLFFNRSASWMDWFANVAGVLSGWGVMQLMSKTLFPRKN